MKRCFYLLVFFSSVISAQERDVRAQLEIQGTLRDMAVAPDGKMWLVNAFGRTYCTGDIYSGWHDCQKNVFGLGQHLALINSISFFNKDTAISIGEKEDTNGREHAACYWTGDGGTSWQMRHVASDGKLFKGCTDKNGNAWAGDISGTIFFSKDFGLTWDSICSFGTYNFTSSLDMATPEEGVASTGQNDIFATSDNWQSYKPVATPCDDATYLCDDPSRQGQINQVAMWGNYIVVNQSGHVFYTKKDTIDWKIFPSDIVDFAVDKEAQQLFAITSSRNVILFTGPQKSRLVSNKALGVDSSPFGPNSPCGPCAGTFIKVANHSLYLLRGGHNLYKVSDDTFFNTVPYTTDYKIQPGVIKRAGKLCVGADGRYQSGADNYGKSIYMSDNDGADWYREQTVDFGILDLEILNDSSLLLWNGEKNLLYSLTSHTLKDYYPEHPFDGFLKYPLKAITLQGRYEGHGIDTGDKVIYTREANTDSFSVSVIKAGDGSAHTNDTIQRNKISPELLLTRLNYINNNTGATPSIADFQISEMDKEKYLNAVDRIKTANGDMAMNEFYAALPGKLDTLSPATIKQILDWQPFPVPSHTLIINIINENGDVIELKNWNGYFWGKPWHLPWECLYKGIAFKCYDVDLSRFTKYCRPDEYDIDEVFDNSNLIMAIADYLYNKRIK